MPTLTICRVQTYVSCAASDRSSAICRLLACAFDMDRCCLIGLNWMLERLLHWFLTFDCVRGIGPVYFSSISCTIVDNSGRPGLRSAECGDLFICCSLLWFLVAHSVFISVPGNPLHLSQSAVVWASDSPIVLILVLLTQNLVFQYTNLCILWTLKMNRKFVSV